MSNLEIVSYLLVVTGIYAIGEFVGASTKARVSSVFVSMLIFLVGFLSGVIPGDIIELSTLQPLTKWAGACIVFHMGTTIKLTDFKREWRTVATAMIGMIGVMIGCVAIIPFIGKANAVVAIPCVTGAIHATRIITTAASELGLVTAAALGTCIYGIQSFVGTPIASFCGRIEANRLMGEFRADKEAYYKKYSSTQVVDASGNRKVPFWEKHEKYFGNFTCIAIAVFAAYIANWIQTFTNINSTVWALFIGVALGTLGIVPNGILVRAKTQGFLNMITFCSVIPNLAKVSLDMLASLLLLLVVIFVAAMVGIALLVLVLPGWKLVGSKTLSFGICACQLLGFPSTLLISEDIAKAIGTNKEEEDAILMRLTPAYVISGMVSVTTISVVIASFFVNFLG